MDSQASRPDQTTPTDGENTSTAGRRLNPLFDEALMGLPPRWTDPNGPIGFGPAEMESWLSAQRSRLRTLLGED